METARTHWRLYTIGFLCSIALILWGAVYANKTRAVVSVSFLNVGEGDATLIQGKVGTQVLVDGGRDRKVLSEIAGALPLFDRSLDVVISAYPDKDNTGGLPFVFEQYTVGKFIVQDGRTNGALGEVLRIAEKQKTEVISPHEGMSIDLGDGSTIEVLYVKGSVMVLQYHFGETCFLFMGGAIEKEESELISRFGESLQCQVLKIGHHGSKSATGEDLLRIVTPSFAIFSNGKDNQYEYPHQEALDRLQLFSIPMLNTRDKGRITFLSDGKAVKLQK